jgi:hypothetical protein
MESGTESIHFGVAPLVRLAASLPSTSIIARSSKFGLLPPSLFPPFPLFRFQLRYIIMAFPTSLEKEYEAMGRMRELMETMKKNQSMRGEAAYHQRMAQRATRNTWRQMKGMQLVMHELNHPGNKPFVIGFGYVIFCIHAVYSYDFL